MTCAVINLQKTSEENDAREGEIVQDVWLFDDDLWGLKTS